MTLIYHSKYETRFTGRNGYFKMKGWTLSTYPGGKVMISPLNSRGNMARCDMEIPKEDLDLFIIHLQKLRDSDDFKQEALETPTSPWVQTALPL